MGGFTLGQIHDVTGRKFGRLTAHWPTGRKPSGVAWLCSCDCGTLVVVALPNLKTGKSCGCYKKDLHFKHGGAGWRPDGIKGTSEYKRWSQIKQRCLNPKCKGWKDYGGRGIKICDRWKNSFANFLSDVGLRPEPHLTLDRINNDGNYEPGNMRWATRAEQSRNRRPRSRWTKR